MNDKNAKDAIYSSSSQTQPNIGISYFTPLFEKIKSKYSIGISGFFPFVRARYFTKITTNYFTMEPIQEIEYSTKDKFTERTSLYFDKLINAEVYRIVLFRQTKDYIEDMDYGLSFQYYKTINQKTAIVLAQSFLNNSKHPSNDYITSINLRHSTWKKWFFYELKPSVNFARKRDYKANYSIEFLVNLYFGDAYN